MSQVLASYTSGHRELVLRSYHWQTAINSAVHLVSLLRPNMQMLDIGYGPGTIPADFAAPVPSGKVMGTKISEEVLRNAHAETLKHGINSVEFKAPKSRTTMLCKGHIRRSPRAPSPSAC